MFELEGNRHDTVDTRPRFQTITTNQTQDYVILAWECEYICSQNIPLGWCQLKARVTSIEPVVDTSERALFSQRLDVVEWRV